MTIQVRPDGPVPAQIMIVGEAPGADEERTGIPFSGVSGQELNKMLGEAGISRSECFVTNVCRERPPQNDITKFIAQSKKDTTASHRLLKGKFCLLPIHTGYALLQREIEMVKPNIIIALGNIPLWALTGLWGITKWRGSMLLCDIDRSTQVIPTYHPAAVLRQWSWRATGVNDLRRAARYRHARWTRPEWKFQIRPSFSGARETLLDLLTRLRSGEYLRLSFDIETRFGQIACAGVSWTPTDALCIPFMVHGRSSGYWSSEQEGELVWLLYKVLTHSHAEVVGQNIIYDSQYTWRHWHFVPRVVQDTMISQHSVFSDLPKALAFIASTYCDYYVYWKDEGKNILDEEDEGRNWFYNCEDCVYTDEAGLVQLNIIKSMGLEHVHEAQQKMFWPVLQAMQRGVKVDLKRRSELTVEVGDAIRSREEFLTNVLGHAINPRSPKQMHTLFYEDLKQPVVFTRPKKGEAARPTLNDDALQTIALREPLLKPIINAISDIRTLGIFLSSFLEADLDIDQRMRCAYNIGGSESGKSAPKTYRLSSSENAFGGGCNLQTIPSEKSKSIGKAAARGAIAGLGDPYQFPNIREIFIPDPGHTWFDLDLDRADLQIVVAECNDVMLKSAMRMGADIHLMNAFVLVGKEPPPLDELVETHPKYKDHRGPYKLAREFAKVFCHGTNYGGGARTMAANTGRTVQEIDRAQKIWFGAHPGIRRWHDRVKAQVLRHRFIENRFGYRWYIFDRVESIIPEAIAWIPQSTVSNIINKIWMAIYEQLPDVQILLQVHDSLCGQMETSKAPSLLPEILRCAKITVPYEDPLIIPVGIKTSEVSWGAVK